MTKKQLPEAEQIYNELLNHIPKLSGYLNHLSPPMMPRLWRNKGLQSLDPHKDWKKSYNDYYQRHFFGK